MKPKQRILLLLFGLLFPYMVFELYFAVRLPKHPLPVWFPYVAAPYFFGSILLFPFLKTLVLRGAAPQAPEEQRVQRVSAARAARMLGYIWLIGPVYYILSGGLSQEPWSVTLFGFSWVGFLSWASFRSARTIEKKSRQNVA